MVQKFVKSFVCLPRQGDTKKGGGGKQRGKRGSPALAESNHRPDQSTKQCTVFHYICACLAKYVDIRDRLLLLLPWYTNSLCNLGINRA